MCVKADFDQVKTAKKGITAYKVCRIGVAGPISLYAPRGRVQQTRNRLGKIRSYRLGKVTKSSFEKTFGIYCYKTEDAACLHRLGLGGPRWGNFKLLKLRIPKGTKYVTGTYEGSQTINAEEVLTLEVMPT